MTHPALLLSLAILAPAASRADTTPPATVHLVQEVYATGVQIYSCEAGEHGPTWIFKSPEADLTNAQLEEQ